MKINLNKLRAELREVPPYEPSKRSEGCGYLYEMLCRSFMQGRKILLSDLDFEAFSSEDVLELAEDYDDSISIKLERNDYIRCRLRETAPLPSVVSFL